MKALITLEHRRATLIFALIALMSYFLTSCQSVRQQERSGCYASKRMSGYGPGGYSYRTHNTTRKSH